MTPTVSRALVLLSGGVDSATCVAFYRSKHFQVQTLFVDYGHPAAEMERDAARAVSSHFDVPLCEATLQGTAVRESGYVPARNALLVTVALATGQPREGLIALGIHDGTRYPDCTRRFVDSCQALADVYANGTIQIAAPFLEWRKGEIVEYARKVRVPLERTYSCEAGGPEPCGRCLSCQDRARM